MKYFKNANGDVFSYENQEDRDIYGAPDLVPMTPDEVHAHIYPVMTEEQMKQSEIDQGKLYLAETDWIIAKIGEASMLGQDTGPLIEQYKERLDAREIARIRIRQNEGRA